MVIHMFLQSSTVIIHIYSVMDKEKQQNNKNKFVILGEIFTVVNGV